MVFYTTHTDMTETVLNSLISGGSIGVGKISAMNHYSEGLGSVLAQNLINKIPTTSSVNWVSGHTVSVNTYLGKFTEWDTTEPYHTTLPLGSLDSPTVKVFPYLSIENGRKYVNLVFKEMIFDSAYDNGADFIATDGTLSVAYTAGLHYRISSSILGVKNVICRVSITYNADLLVIGEKGIYGDDGTLYFEYWDGDGFGDDNTFLIKSNESTFIDDNGNIGVCGTKRIATDKFEKVK